MYVPFRDKSAVNVDISRDGVIKVGKTKLTVPEGDMLPPYFAAIVSHAQ